MQDWHCCSEIPVYLLREMKGEKHNVTGVVSEGMTQCPSGLKVLTWTSSAVVLQTNHRTHALPTPPHLLFINVHKDFTVLFGEINSEIIHETVCQLLRPLQYAFCAFFGNVC